MYCPDQKKQKSIYQAHFLIKSENSNDRTCAVHMKSKREDMSNDIRNGFGMTLDNATNYVLTEI